MPLVICILMTICITSCSSSSTNFQWALENKGQEVNRSKGTIGVDIDFVRMPFSSQKIVIAIIDTGFANSPYLADRIFINEGEIKGDGIDNDENGFIDDYQGWDFSAGSSINYNSITVSHGTEIAHIIASNSDEYIGVSTNSLLMNIKIDEQDLSPELLVEAINYAESMGAHIVNLSLVLKENDDLLYSTMRNSKMLFVCAAGNEHNEECLFPGCYELDNVISVGGITCKGLISSFSNYGVMVDIAAPGEDIVVLDHNLNLNYSSGSSFATAFVSGIAAEVMALHPSVLTASDVKEILLASSTKDISLRGYIQCNGIVSMENAVNLALHDNAE